MAAVPIVIQSQPLAHTLQSTMEPFPAELEPVVALWAPRAEVVLAQGRVTFSGGQTLCPMRHIAVPAEEGACSFDVPRMLPVRDEEPRLVGFEDLMLRPLEPKKGRLAQVRLTLRKDVPPEDSSEWLVGADLAATGIPLEVLQALWAIDTEHVWFNELRNSFVANAENASVALVNQQSAYLHAYGTQLDLLTPLHRLLHKWVYFQVALHIRREDTWHTRRHALALLK